MNPCEEVAVGGKLSYWYPDARFGRSCDVPDSGKSNENRNLITPVVDAALPTPSH